MTNITKVSTAELQTRSDYQAVVSGLRKLATDVVKVSLDLYVLVTDLAPDQEGTFNGDVRSALIKDTDYSTSQLNDLFRAGKFCYENNVGQLEKVGVSTLARLAGGSKQLQAQVAEDLNNGVHVTKSEASQLVNTPEDKLQRADERLASLGSEIARAKTDLEAKNLKKEIKVAAERKTSLQDLIKSQREEDEPEDDKEEELARLRAELDSLKDDHEALIISSSKDAADAQQTRKVLDKLKHCSPGEVMDPFDLFLHIKGNIGRFHEAALDFGYGRTRLNQDAIETLQGCFSAALEEWSKHLDLDVKRTAIRHLEEVANDLPQELEPFTLKTIQIN